MPNGKQFISDLDFSKRMKEMPDRQLLEFTAEQTYEISQLCQKHNRRLNDLEKRDNKKLGITGGVGVFVATIISSLITHYTEGKW